MSAYLSLFHASNLQEWGEFNNSRHIILLRGIFHQNYNLKFFHKNVFFLAVNFLVKLQLFINQKCSTVKGDSADWACAMPRNQSVCRVGFAFTGLKILIELCRLKGDSGVLKTV